MEKEDWDAVVVIERNCAVIVVLQELEHQPAVGSVVNERKPGGSESLSGQPGRLEVLEFWPLILLR